MYKRSKDVCPKGQQSPEWVEGREKLLITGTTLGGLLPPYHLWKGRSSRRDCVKRTVFGYKPPVGAFLQKMFDSGKAGEFVAIDVVKSQVLKPDEEILFPGLLVALEDERWGGSPDGVVVDKETREPQYVVECKTLTRRAMQYDSDGAALVPLYYYTQAHWYMWLVGVRSCAFVQYMPASDEVAVTWLDFDDARFALALGAARTYTIEHEGLTTQIDCLVQQIANLKKCGEVEPLTAAMRCASALDDLLRVIEQDAAPPTKRLKKVAAADTTETPVQVSDRSDGEMDRIIAALEE